MPFERPGDSGIENEKNTERLKESLKEVATDLRDNGFAVQDDCRVDMGAFLGVSEASDYRVKMHMQNIEGKELKFRDKEAAGRGYKPRGQGSISNKDERSGEQLEGLKTVIFHKFLKGDFFTMRTSLYDDFKNGIDNLIIEKETGSVVGAFDEVVDTASGDRLIGKEQKILDKNLRGGGVIRYGFDIIDNDGEDKMVPTAEAKVNIPIFHLALSKEDLEKGMREFVSISDESGFEEVLFSRFTDSIKSQVAELRTRETELNPAFMESLDIFADRLFSADRTREE